MKPTLTKYTMGLTQLLTKNSAVIMKPTTLEAKMRGNQFQVANDKKKTSETVANWKSNRTSRRLVAAVLECGRINRAIFEALRSLNFLLLFRIFYFSSRKIT